MTGSSLTGARTTFARLLDHFGGQGVSCVEIPAIQRDYAQGRTDERSRAVRDGFLDALAKALDGGTPIELDFIYGGTSEEGAFAPVDGQQRLTSLFLLHWYLACKTGAIELDGSWKRFEYATRPSARMFCHRLVDARLMSGGRTSRAWIEDQPWFMHTWRREPTIVAMLVMIDAIAARCESLDPDAAWAALHDDNDPAISFYALSIESLGSGDELYIKMNSRGKPLTDFEIFKARFEQVIPDPDRREEFSVKVDGPWSDMLWNLRGSDNAIDDELLRYLDFVITISEWRFGGGRRGKTLIDRATALYAGDAGDQSGALDFLFQSLDAWVGIESRDYFGDLFALEPDRDEAEAAGRVLRFGKVRALDLFADCCNTFVGARSYSSNAFSLADMLVFYGVLLHRVNETPEFARRMRSLRNLVEASDNEIRLGAMALLLADVEALIVDGDLDRVKAFNLGQRDEEVLKYPVRDAETALGHSMRRLEDHPQLRGSLAAFELEREVFESRATAFEQVMGDPSSWMALTGALLAANPYQRGGRPGRFRFGTASANQSNVWRELLTGVQRDAMREVRESLGRALDAVAESDGGAVEALDTLANSFTDSRRTQRVFDWRYYLVAYPAARSGESGRYVSPDDQMGFELCMLDRTQLNSYYRDPYLSAIVSQVATSAEVAEPWFTGRAWLPRWLQMPHSEIGIRSAAGGLEVSLGGVDALAKIEAWAANRGLTVEQDTLGEVLLVRVPQREMDGVLADQDDRVQIGASLVELLGVLE